MFQELGKDLLMSASQLASRSLADFGVKDVRFESAGQNRQIWALTLPLVQLLEKLSGKVKVIGCLPDEGSALIVSNHISGWDPVWIYWSGLVATRTRRSIQFIARRSLMFASYQESTLARDGRTQADMFAGKGVRKLREALVRGFGTIPISLTGTLSEWRETLFLTSQFLDRGGVIGIFIEGHRKPLGGLLNYKQGAGLIAMRHPDVPIIPCAVVGTDQGILSKMKTVSFGHSFTFNQLKKHCPDLSLTKRFEQLDFVSCLLADRIAQLSIESSPDLYLAWFRAKEIMSRYPELSREYLLKRVRAGDSDLSETMLILNLGQEGNFNGKGVKEFLKTEDSYLDTV